MRKASVRGFVAAAIVGLVATALPGVAGGASSTKCSSNQIDVGGTCTSRGDVATQILSITRSVKAKEDAKGVLLRIDIGNDTLVNRGLGISQVGVAAAPN